MPTKTVIDFIGLHNGESFRNTEDVHVAGKIDGAFNLNGSTDLVDIGNVPALNPVKEGLSKHGDNPVLTTPGDGFASVFKDGSTYFIWSGSATHIYRHSSTDGKNWSNRQQCTGLTMGNVPSVWKEGSTWHMLYRKGGGAYTVINYATSNDGLAWTDQGTKVAQGGVGEWDYNINLDPWGVIKVDSTYYLWYNTIGGAGRKTGLATTTNLAGSWSKDVNNPMFDGGRFCAWPFKYGHDFYLAIPHYNSGVTPDRHAEIELYKDSVPTFYPNSRKFVRCLANPGPSAEWDEEFLDTPCVLSDDVHRNSYAASNREFWMYYAGQDNPIDKIVKTGMVIEPNFLTALDEKRFSCSFWMKHGLGLTKNILSFGNTGEKYGLRIRNKAGAYGSGNLEFGTSQGMVETTRPAGEDWNDMLYHFVVCTWAGIDETTAKIYVDGKLEPTVSSGTFVCAANEAALHLGCHEVDGTPGYYFMGVLDDVKLYDGILTLERIKQLMKV